MIPKILHQVWVGPKPRPEKWLRTWKDKHQSWEYILWDNKKLAQYPFKNRKEIDQMMSEEKYHGVADIIRYQIMYDLGGAVMPADSECVNPIDELLGVSAFTCYENEAHYPGRLTPVLGAIKGYPLFRELTDGLKGKEINEPWIDTGNCYLTEMVAKSRYPITIYPSYYFMPNHRLGDNYDGTSKIYSLQYSGTTFGLYDQHNYPGMG